MPLAIGLEETADDAKLDCIELDFDDTELDTDEKVLDCTALDWDDAELSLVL